MHSLTVTTEYDSNRTALINVRCYSNSLLAFNLAAQQASKVAVTANINVREQAEDRLEYTAYLKFIKPGVYINSLEYKPLGGAKYVRAGLTYAKLVSLSALHAIIKLRSHILLKVKNTCIATVGVLLGKVLSTSEFVTKLHTAGYTRRMGRRPHVRGVAMNPIDHPHGGGQGKTSGGRPSVTP